MPVYIPWPLVEIKATCGSQVLSFHYPGSGDQVQTVGFDRTPLAAEPSPAFTFIYLVMPL